MVIVVIPLLVPDDLTKSLTIKSIIQKAIFR